MIDIHEVFEAGLRVTSEPTVSSLLCPFVQYSSSLTMAAAAVAAQAVSNPSTVCQLALLPNTVSSASTPSLPRITPLHSLSSSSSFSVSKLSSFPYSSFLSRFFSRHEPLFLFNFDINPNTSVFGLTFLGAMVLQIAGFYLFRHLVPHLSRADRKSQRGLSWVLTFFSAIVLFSGTFTLSSNMEWRPNLTLQSGAADGAGGSRTLLSLRNFPQESDLATMYSAYFVSYLICDLMLGMVHYRAYLDPLSGWAHHLGYMGVISTATLQKSVPAFMAMGAPIEVSTIFLASGHIFPKLRSDILFATTFFLSRIVYPIVLLPELYLNVESRLGLKVVLMALMVHIHWFRKFVQQQMRYYRERQGAKTSDDTAIPTASMAAPEKQILLDDIENNIELQWTRSITSEQVKANHCGSRRSSNSSTGSNGSDTASSRIYSRTPSFDHDILVTQPCEPLNDSEADTDADSDDAHPSPRPATLKFDTPIFSTVSNTAPGTAKIIQQLLKECDQDGFSAYARSMKGAIGGGNNKTFSAMALKKLMSSQGSSASGPGAVRLSRPLSMRDTKRRIALDEVRFEDPRVKSGKDSMALERPKEAKEDQDLDATVVLRRPSPRASVVVQEDKEFGTIRVLSSRQST